MKNNKLLSEVIMKEGQLFRVGDTTRTYYGVLCKYLGVEGNDYMIQRVFESENCAYYQRLLNEHEVFMENNRFGVCKNLNNPYSIFDYEKPISVCHKWFDNHDIILVD